MYKILIAEDTALIRRGIISMIHWEQLDCVLAGEAKNGKEALQMIDVLKPDIILLDVKMPQLDGMKVLDYITELKIQTKIIIISGYSNFEYVKHALRSNTVDYILKPIHEEELNQALSKAIGQIVSRKANNSVSPSGSPEHQLTSLLEENIYSTFDDIRRILSYDISAPPIYFWVASFKNKYNSYAYFKATLETLVPPSIRILFHEHADRMDVIFSSPSENDYQVSIHLLHHVYMLADDLLKNMLYIGLSNLHSSDYIITKAYYEAHKALCNKMLCSGQYLLPYQDFSHKNYRLDDVFQSENTLLDFLMSGNYTRSVVFCREIIEKHLQSPSICLDEFCMLLTEFYCTLLKTNTDYVGDIQREISILHNLENLLDYSDCKPLIDNFYKYCSIITNEIISRRTDIDSSILEIQKYIDQHFSEQITLKSLENLFHLNGSYISVTFKKITGTGISKYIRRLRMEYAIKLLSTTDYKMSDVCEKSGFTNYVHFSKEFKKYTGLSPSDYRLAKNESIGK